MPPLAAEEVALEGATMPIPLAKAFPGLDLSRPLLLPLASKPFTTATAVAVHLPLPFWLRLTLGLPPPFFPLEPHTLALSQGGCDLPFAEEASAGPVAPFFLHGKPKRTMGCRRR